MNKTRNGIFAAVTILALAAGGLNAQTSIQSITLSLVGEYATNSYYINGTNAGTNNVQWSSEFTQIRPIIISTAGVKRTMAIDLLGTDYTIWNGSELVREVNLTNGNEGIFLRKGSKQTNVTTFFDGSSGSNFMAGLPGAFPALSNNISGLTENVAIYSNNYSLMTNISIPQTQLTRGWLHRPDISDTNVITTNYLSTAGVYFVSLDTTNIKFNVVGSGNGSATMVSGSVDGVLYQRSVDSEYMLCVGTFYLNLSTNFYGPGTVPPVFVTGPIRGTFAVGPPTFSEIPGP